MSACRSTVSRAWTKILEIHVSSYYLATKELWIAKGSGSLEILNDSDLTCHLCRRAG